jgi:hypothetical protein
VRLLRSREAASILVPLGKPSPDAGTPSPDSGHLIIKWPSEVGTRIIGVGFLADGNKESRFIDVVPSRSTMDAEVTHVEVERFVSPQRPSGCSTKMTAATAASFISR